MHNWHDNNIATNTKVTAGNTIKRAQIHVQQGTHGRGVISAALDVARPPPRGAAPPPLQVQLQSSSRRLSLEVAPRGTDEEEQRDLRADVQSQLLSRPEEHGTHVQFGAAASAASATSSSVTRRWR